MVVKPSKSEQEYFVAQEVARLKKLREQHNQELQAEQRAKMKELHYLHCAKCGQHMETSNMHGIEIEICPDCGGIYLDSGELARIMDEERSGLKEVLAFARRFWNEK